MQLHDYVRFAQKWGVIALITAIVVAAATYTLTKKLIKPTYTAEVVLRVDLGIGQTGSGIVSDSQQFSATAAAMAQEPSVTGETMRRLQAIYPQLLTPRESARIQKSVSCASNGLTTLFSCTVSSRSPQLAAAAANMLAQVFIETEANQTAQRYAPILLRVRQQENTAHQAISRDQQRLQTLLSKIYPNATLLANVQTQLQSDQARYDSLVQQENDLRQAETSSSSTVTVTEPAAVPTAPSSPRPPLNAAIAFLLAFLVIAAGGFVADRLDESIHDEAELRTFTHLPVLGFVPSVSRLRSRRLSPDALVLLRASDSPAAEAYRLLRSSILFNRAGGSVQSLLITSTTSEEGKSVVAANLAAAFAESGKSTILVDLALRHPSVDQIFDSANRRGIGDLLAESHPQPNQYLLDTALPFLRVLPVGSSITNPAESLVSRRLALIMQQLRAAADLVVIDGPSVLGAADAAALAPLVDASVVVFRPDQVKRPALVRAVAVLRRVGMPIVGLVVNARAEFDGAVCGADEYGQPAPAIPFRPRLIAADQELNVS